MISRYMAIIEAGADVSFTITAEVEMNATAMAIAK